MAGVRARAAALDALIKMLANQPVDPIQVAMAKMEHEERTARGRWMVVCEDRLALRISKLSEARRMVNRHRDAGIGAFYRRWSRKDVVWDHPTIGWRYLGDVAWIQQRTA